MTRFNLFASLALGAMCALLPAASQAGTIEIQFTGLDLVYDGSTIEDDELAGADDLTSVVITDDGVPSAGSPYSVDVSLDLEIPGVTDISVLGDTVTSDPGGSLTLGFAGGDFLSLALDEVTVTYVDGGFARFAFGGSVSAIVGQSLPDGIVIGDPTSLSFSSTLNTSTDDGINLTSFTALASGEIEGTDIPEPGTVALGLMAGLMATAAGMRARLG